MDEKFVENLGMSAHVDEGLWDRLKSRAASIAQGSKNLSGGRLGNVGTTESAKFNSLFRSFVAEELAIIKSLDNAVVPWAKHFTPEEEAQVHQIEALEQALKRIDFGKLPVTEALPSFSNLGARWAGGVQKMLDSYKKRIASTYDNFIKDVEKLNIVPSQYIQRKIASSKSGAYEALKALEPVIGKSVTASVPAPTSAPSAPSAPAPKPVPAASTPSPTAPASTPPPATPAAPPTAKTPTSPPVPTSPVPPKPAATTPTAPASTAPTAAPAAPSAPAAPKETPITILTKKAINKIINTLTSGDMADAIGGYINRDASKAETTFPANPPVSITNSDGVTTVWHLRYRSSKEAANHHIQVLAETRKRSPETGREEIINRSDKWEDFLTFGPDDIVDDEGEIKKDLDVLKLMERSNPELGKAISENFKATGQTIDPKTNQALADALDEIVQVSVPQPERGERQLNKAVTPEPEKVGSGPGEPPPPIEPPKAKEKMVNPPPEKQARVEKIPPPEPAKEPSKVSGPASSSPSAEPESPEEPEEPEEPSSKLKDLVPKDKKSKAKPALKKAPKPAAPKAPKAAPKAPKAPVPDKAVAPVAAAPKKPVVAPTEPAAPAPQGKSPFGTDAERLKRFNNRWTIPNKLPPLKSVEQMNKFRSALGSEENPPSWKIEFAYQQATGQHLLQKPSAPAPAPAPAAKKAKPRQKMTEDFDVSLKDFFPL